MVSKKIRCDIAVTYTLPINVRRDKDLDTIVGTEHHSSGAGLGGRDLEWTVMGTPTQFKEIGKALSKVSTVDYVCVGVRRTPRRILFRFSQ